MKEEIAQIVQTYEQAKEDQKEVEKQEVQQKEKPAFKKNYVKQRLPEDKDIFMDAILKVKKQRFMRLSMRWAKWLSGERSFSWRPGRSATRRPS